MQVNFNTKRLTQEQREQFSYLCMKVCFGDVTINISDTTAKEYVFIEVGYKNLKPLLNENFVLSLDELYTNSYMIKELLRCQNHLVMLKSDYLEHIIK